MKLPRRIEGSICGTGFNLRQPWYHQSASTRASCAGTKPTRYCSSRSQARPTHPPSRSESSRQPSVLHLSAVSSGSFWPRGACFFTASYPRHTSISDGQKRAQAVPQDLARPAKTPITKEELLSLVGTYNANDTVEDHLEIVRDPYLRRYAPENGQEISVSRKIEDARMPSIDEVTAPNDEEREILEKLEAAVALRRRNYLNIRASDIYEIYIKLPEPRMSYLHANLRHSLLRCLSQYEKPTSRSMLQYFAVIADVKKSGYSLLPGQWNRAIIFASRYVGIMGEKQVAAALTMWREMELEAGTKADRVTFNILFDAASKAGNFTLSEMLYSEMERRGIPFNHFHHVTLIYFFGLKMDGDGVRAAYREMVESGEVITHVVLNCVVASLLRCGEETEALDVYERMKALHSRGSLLPPRNQLTQKAITRALMMFTRIGREHPSLIEGFQSAAPLAPDLQTYRILIRHYAVKVGDLGKVAQYLDEMKTYMVPVHGGIFLSIFKGFAMHGAPAGSDWSPQRLFSVWEALLRALDGGASGLHVDTWLVMWVLRAFENCGQKKMIMDLYDELSSRWDLPADKAEFMLNFVQQMVKRVGLRVDSGRR